MSYEKIKISLSECGDGLTATIRIVAVIFMTVLPSLCLKAHTEISDTTVVSAQARGRIDFKVNLTDVDREYHGNNAQLEKVLTGIDSMVLNPHMKVERITVVGTASPEGPYHTNERLATIRAQAFVGLLKSRYSFPDSIYAVSVIPEDWEGMRLMLTENNSIPYSEVVLSFIDETEQLDPSAREYRLINLDGGRPYRSMHDNVFPHLRRASVLVDYDTEWIKLHRTFALGSLTPPAVDMSFILPEISPISPLYPIFPLYTEHKQRFFAIKSNLLGDLALCANLGFEVELCPHWSLDVPVWYSPYDITERWRIRLLAVQPEVRYWLKDAGSGHYFGIHTTVAGFDVSLNGDWRYQDPNHAAFGLGIGYGYSFHLDKARRWALEAQIGAGYINYKWIKYHNTGHDGAEYSRGDGTYWGVTRAGLTLSYKFYFERKGRRWMKW